MIFKKMNEVMKDIGAVTKDQKNTAQGFKFRGIDQFVNALYPALCKHGVFMAPSVVSESHELKEVTRSNGKAGVDKHVHLQVNYAFYAEDGSSVVIGPIAAEGLDSGDKATNKALSAGLKYALIQTFSIPTEDMAEADLESPEIGAPKAPATVTQLPKPTTASKPLEAVLEAAPPAVGSSAAKPTRATFRKKNTPAPAAAATAAVETPASDDSSGWDS
jgi:hypothetical protein